MNIFFANTCKVSKMVRLGKVSIGSIEPLSFLQFLERVCISIWIMLDNRLNLPELRALNIRFITQKYIDLSLPVLILEVVIEMPLNRSEKLESALCCFLYLLLVS